MANAIQLGGFGQISQGKHSQRSTRDRGGSDFESLLRRSLLNVAPGASPALTFGGGGGSGGGSSTGPSGVTASSASASLGSRSASAIPTTANDALNKAMARENVPASWKDSLSYIMTQESGGQVSVSNPSSSARGLFQLTQANYHLNPNGAASFGDAVEEAQGGIRYIRDRYGSADAAAQFWQDHHWY